MHQIIEALKHLEKFQTSLGNALDGVTPYQNCSCRPVTSLKKVSVAYYRFLILKVVSKDYFCLRNLERFSQRIYWQYFLKLTKMTGKDNIQRNTNHKSNKKQALNTTNAFPFTASHFPWQVSIVTLETTYMHFLNQDRGIVKLPPDW